MKHSQILAAGEIRLGTTNSMIAGFVPAVIDRFSQQYPKVVFEVLPAATFADQYVDLRERKIDLILGRLGTPATGAADLKSEILFHDPMVPAAAVGSKWHRRRKIELGGLRDAPWSIPPDSSFVRPLIDEAFRSMGLEAPSHTVGSNSVQLSTALWRPADLSVCFQVRRCVLAASGWDSNGCRRSAYAPTHDRHRDAKEPGSQSDSSPVHRMRA